MSDLPSSARSFGTGYVARSKSSESDRRQPSAPPGTSGLNPLAVASFALVFVAGVLAPVTLVMACLARSQLRSSGQAGRGLANAALIISCVYLAAGAVVAMLYAFVA